MYVASLLSVVTQVRRAIEWLGDKGEARRYAAALILRELAENAPAVFNVHVRAFIDAIWNGLRDPKQLVREASVAALRVRPPCLHLVNTLQLSVKISCMLKVAPTFCAVKRCNADQDAAWWHPLGACYESGSMLCTCHMVRHCHHTSVVAWSMR